MNDAALGILIEDVHTAGVECNGNLVTCTGGRARGNAGNDILAVGCILGALEVEVEVGQFATAHVITVNDATVVTASVHSYMKTAFEAEAADPDAMIDAQVNLLNALYQWDKAVAEAN